MSEFLVEVYVPRSVALGSVPGRADISRAAHELTQAGVQVRLTGSIVVPEEETCFYLFEAKSADAVRAAVERSGLRCERVVEAASERTLPEASWTSCPVEESTAAKRPPAMSKEP